MLPDQWSMREYLVYLKLTVATCIENPSTSYSWKKSVPLCVQASGRNTWKVAYCCPVIHRFTLGAEVMQHDHGHYYSTSFFYQPLSARGWTSAFLLAVHRMCGVIEGRLSHFLPRWLRTGWRSAISQGKSLEILRRGWELNPGHGEDRQWAIPLSYHDWLLLDIGSQKFSG